LEIDTPVYSETSNANFISTTTELTVQCFCKRRLFVVGTHQLQHNQKSLTTNKQMVMQPCYWRLPAYYDVFDVKISICCMKQRNASLLQTLHLLLLWSVWCQKLKNKDDFSISYGENFKTVGQYACL